MKGGICMGLKLEHVTKRLEILLQSTIYPLRFLKMKFLAFLEQMVQGKQQHLE